MFLSCTPLFFVLLIPLCFLVLTFLVALHHRSFPFGLIIILARCILLGPNVIKSVAILYAARTVIAHQYWYRKETTDWFRLSRPRPRPRSRNEGVLLLLSKIEKQRTFLDGSEVVGTADHASLFRSFLCDHLQPNRESNRVASG